MKQITTALGRTLRYTIVGLLGLTLLSSCSKDDPYDVDDSTAAQVNLINASPDGPSAQLYVDDVLRTPSGVTYGQASGYYKTFVGDQDVLIKSTSGEATLATSRVQLDAIGNYSIFLVGQNSSLGILAVTDDLVAPASGKAKIRYVNASPNASAASLNAGSTILVTPLNFRGISASTEVTAGSYVLSIVTGTSRSATINANLESGKIYTVYAKGLVGGTGAAAFGVGLFTNK